MTSASVTIVRFGRRRAGARYPSSTLNRRPRRCETGTKPTPSLSAALRFSARRDARGLRRVDERLGEDMLLRERCERERALRAACEHGLDVRPRPARAAGRGPLVVVRPPAAKHHHRVHRRRPAEHAPAREDDLAAVECLLRRRRVTPVDVGAIELRERRRDLDLQLPRARAGLDQEHRDVRILGEARREDAARRAGSDDDDVVHGARIGRDVLGTKACPTCDGLPPTLAP